MADSTVVVSIGRNIGDTPMHIDGWDTFRSEVFDAVEKACSTIHFFGDGYGVYEGHEEESYTVIGTLADEYDMSLYRDCCDLASKWFQDSIAITIGTTAFAPAKWARRHTAS